MGGGGARGGDGWLRTWCEAHAHTHTHAHPRVRLHGHTHLHAHAQAWSSLQCAGAASASRLRSILVNDFAERAVKAKLEGGGGAWRGNGGLSARFCTPLITSAPPRCCAPAL